jgi:hypothetical protein
MIFPWAWYLSLPARMVYVVGDAIDMRSLAEAEGIDDFQRPDRGKLQRVAERVRMTMQSELDRHVRRYGRWPYQFRSLMGELHEAHRRGKLGRVLPTGWPVRFVRISRDHHRPAARGRLQAVLRDWDLLGFYLPLGWLLLSLARALRRPPYGYRGLTKEERLEREGQFIWRLGERPLPPRADGDRVSPPVVVPARRVVDPTQRKVIRAAGES